MRNWVARPASTAALPGAHLILVPRRRVFLRAGRGGAATGRAAPSLHSHVGVSEFGSPTGPAAFSPPSLCRACRSARSARLLCVSPSKTRLAANYPSRGPARPGASPCEYVLAQTRLAAESPNKAYPNTVMDDTVRKVGVSVRTPTFHQSMHGLSQSWLALAASARIAPDRTTRKVGGARRVAGPSRTMSPYRRSGPPPNKANKTEGNFLESPRPC